MALKDVQIKYYLKRSDELVDIIVGKIMGTFAYLDADKEICAGKIRDILESVIEVEGASELFAAETLTVQAHLIEEAEIVNPTPAQDSVVDIMKVAEDCASEADSE